VGSETTRNAGTSAAFRRRKPSSDAGASWTAGSLETLGRFVARRFLGGLGFGLVDELPIDLDPAHEEQCGPFRLMPCSSDTLPLL